jgi:hypothetical protein
MQKHLDIDFFINESPFIFISIPLALPAVTEFYVPNLQIAKANSN